MPYVTSWERIGIEKGLERGREQGLEQGREQGMQLGELREKHAVLKRQFDRKFGLLPEDAELIDATDAPERLDAALDAIIDASERDEVLRHLTS
ncbi:MAG: hypothetical protein PF508_05295 [Spirochaeta sp.]|jgi:predicted transposase YdaD|nr:hypothetical protein [Spirochaeta sp.]